MHGPTAPPSPLALFNVALDLDSPSLRATYLDQACAGDAVLRARVEALLDAHGRAGEFLSSPFLEATLVDVVPDTGEFAGSVIGPYKLLEQIGEGGMGVVHVAEQCEPIRRKVALKVIKPGMDSKQVIARFEAERQALAMMDHPNIAKVLDAGSTQQGRPYFVMELVHGIPITEYCDREQLSIPERLELFMLVCRAVHHAHQKGIIHRDLKPSNILVSVHDSTPVPKVIDFGIAKAISQPLTDKTIYTAFAQIVGTPLYMSPEQADLSGLDVDTRSDIYSLGVLLYELLTGTTPFDYATLRKAPLDEMRRIIREEEPPKPSTRLSTLGNSITPISTNRKADARQLNRAIRGELDWIVMKAIEKERCRRYDTASDFAADLMRFLNHQPVDACPPSVWYRFKKAARRHRTVLTTASLVGLTLVAGTAASALQAVRAKDAEQQAQADFRRAKDTVDRIFIRVSEDLEKTPGLEKIRRALLKDALEFYQDFLKAHGSDPAVRFEAARTAHRVGSIQELLGHFDKVVAPLEQAIGLLDRLIADSPQEASYRVEWAECNSDLGQVYGLSLGPPKGIQYRRKALAEYEKLVKDHPENAIYRRRLASRQCNLGLSLSTESQNQFEEAEQHLRSALEKWKQIQADSPGRSEDRLECARMHHWLGNLLMQTSRRDEAERELKAALAILENLLAANKHDPNIASRFAHTKSYLVGLMLNRRKLKEAEQLQREAIALLQPLVTAYPDVIYYTRRLGLDYVSLASTLWALGDHRNADMEFCKALATAERMVKEHPDARDFPNKLASTLYHQGLFLDEWNRPEESAESFRRASDIYEDLVARFTSDIRNQANLTRVLVFCPAPQFRDAPRAINLAKQLLRQKSTSADYWSLLGVAHYRAEQWTAAAEALEKAIELDPTEPHPPLFLAMTRWKQGNKEQAKSHYERAARLIDENHYADMESRHFQRDAAALLGMKPPEVKDRSAK